MFDSFDKFMNWYNTVRFHESLDTKWYLQTPDIAFWARLPEGCKSGMFLNRMETELNSRKKNVNIGVHIAGLFLLWFSGSTTHLFRLPMKLNT